YGKEYELKPIKTTSLEKIAFFLSDPNIIVLLLLAGILAIFLEIKMPGTFIFAALGITCIILFLIGISIIPINYLALLLILAGIALVIAEVFIPSFGLLTLSAIIALASGLYLFFEREGTMGLRVSMPLIIIIISIFVITILSIGFLVFRDMRKRSVVGLEKFIGKRAKVIKWSDGRGKVMIDGEIWDAIGKNQDLNYNKDDIVNIVDFKDMYLIVE
ncbi:MAG: NfeD family protein, partial [Deferribacterota bacterium]|nr:NfeD family protein [Deferribacterota bacterium]